MRHYRPSAVELAILVVIMIQRYSKERDREVTRCRIARSSLRRLAIRDQLRDALVDDWVDVMALDYGWLVFEHDDEFVLLKADAAQTWTKIGTRRCDDLIGRLRHGDGKAIDDAENEIEPRPDVDEGDDE
jgi:hypothetical protein